MLGIALCRVQVATVEAGLSWHDPNATSGSWVAGSRVYKHSVPGCKCGVSQMCCMWEERGGSVASVAAVAAVAAVDR